MSSKAQIAASARYDKTHAEAVTLKLNKKNDADILQQLAVVGNRQGYIKELIRRDLQQKGGVLSTQNIKTLILPIAIKYGFDKLVMFGSYARGDANAESDVDLLAEGGDIRELYRYSQAVEDLKTALGRDVDLVEAGALEGSRAESSVRLLAHIREEGVTVYDKTGHQG